MIVGAIAFIVGAIWAFGHRRPRDEVVVQRDPRDPPRPPLLSGRQLELGEHGPVIAAGQLLDRVVADPDAPVDQHVVDRRAAAGAGGGRARSGRARRRGSRDVVVAAVEQVAEVALVERGVEVAERGSRSGRGLGPGQVASDRRPSRSSTVGGITWTALDLDRRRAGDAHPTSVISGKPAGRALDDTRPQREAAVETRSRGRPAGRQLAVGEEGPEAGARRGAAPASGRSSSTLSTSTSCSRTRSTQRPAPRPRPSFMFAVSTTQPRSGAAPASSGRRRPGEGRRRRARPRTAASPRRHTPRPPSCAAPGPTTTGSDAVSATYGVNASSATNGYSPESSPSSRTSAHRAQKPASSQQTRLATRPALRAGTLTLR